MNRWIRRTAVAVAALVAAGAAAVLAAQLMAERKAQRRFELPAYAVAVRTDAAGLERGRYLYESRGCADCHGSDGAGRVFIDDPKSGLKVRAANLTAGAGGAVAGYTATDWERSIRHGVRRDGTPLRVMPSEDYNRLTDADLGALVGYLQQLPPAAGEPVELRLPLVVKLLYAAGVVEDAAAKIDHTLPPSTPIPEGVTAAHGGYVAAMCVGCHGAGLSGGKIPGGPPDWPAAANLTPGAGSAMAAYANAEQFTRMLRTGKRPDGSAVSPVMPFGSLAKMSDVDAAALHAYLQTVPARPTGQR